MLCTFVWVQASETERYSLSELRADLSGCDARHVHVIVDQSYSGEASRSLRRARPGLNLRQVGIYSSGRDNEYSFGDDFTSAWTRLNHTRMCTKDVFRVSVEVDYFLLTWMDGWAKYIALGISDQVEITVGMTAILQGLEVIILREGCREGKSWEACQAL